MTPTILTAKSVPVLGKTLGNFVITAPLGEGGMGEVFLAEHRRMGRKVAIKLLRPQYSVDPEAVERLFNEARATSMISHPGIVQIFDCDVFEGRAYLVMEFLEGQSLREHISSWDRPNAEHVMSLSSQIASVLNAAHEKGIVHRDLKPDNVFLLSSQDASGGLEVKVLDFGIAKLRRAPADGVHLTGTGMLLGTPLYMSPEQCRGNGAIDERSDIYSLGCMMFEMLAGTPPFVSAGSGELIAAHLYQPPPLLIDRAPQTPSWLCALVAQMLNKAPAQRPASMRDVAQALRNVAPALPAPTARVGQTLILPPSQLPVAPRVSAAPTTTLSASAHAATLTKPSHTQKRWVPVGIGVVLIAGVGFWVLSSPQPHTRPRLAAPTPAQHVAGSVKPTAAPDPAPAIDTTNADAAAAPAPAPAPADVVSTEPEKTHVPHSPKPKPKTQKPFRGFDEL